MRPSSSLLLLWVGALGIAVVGTALAIPMSQSLFWAVRVVYGACTLAFPGIVLVAAVAVARVRAWSPSDVIWIVLSAAAPGFVRLYATHLEPRRLEVREISISTDKVDRELRILHLSDIQSFRVGSYEKKAFALARSLHPDLVVHTGDLVQPDKGRVPKELMKLLDRFEALEAPLGRYGVVGDTDEAASREIWRQRPQALGLLEDRTTTVELGNGGKLRILGLGLTTARSPKRARPLMQALVDTSTDAFTLVLGHPPDFVLGNEDLPVDLNLAGHTHGGQIRIPGWGPIVTLSNVPREWARGFRTIGRTRLNVSAGIGAEHAAGLPSIRLFCPPEMTLIRLVPMGSVIAPNSRGSQ